MNNLSSYESNYRNLTSTKLFTYCAGRGITLKEDTFENELDFKTEKGKYNLLAQLFSDNYDISVKINFYSTETKGDSLFKVKEIKESCLILMLDKALQYGDVINLIQADERNRVMERKDVPLFDINVFNEFVFDAFVFNDWTGGKTPIISIFNNRIEIETYIENGELNDNGLRDLLLKLHVLDEYEDERAESYDENMVSINKKSMVFTLPFRFLD